jgi:3',5'-cyclic AMP phosphodiesterase CpdA
MTTFQLLHISDLHIKDSKEDKFDRRVVLDPLIKRVKEDCEKGLRPEIVVVTGDVAFKQKIRCASL